MCTGDFSYLSVKVIVCIDAYFELLRCFGGCLRFGRELSVAVCIGLRTCGVYPLVVDGEGGDCRVATERQCLGLHLSCIIQTCTHGDLYISGGRVHPPLASSHA